MYSSVNYIPEDGFEAPKHVREASQNNKHLWSHVKLFGLNNLYLKTQFSNFLSPKTFKKIRQIRPRDYLSTTP
jgi:hypothetical protein